VNRAKTYYERIKYFDLNSFICISIAHDQI
jgi:hypothetical protein